MTEAFALSFFQQKYWQISDIKVWNFNETLTNEIVRFEQLGPELLICRHIVWPEEKRAGVSQNSPSEALLLQKLL